MSNNLPRCIRIAKNLVAEKDVLVPRSVFQDIMSQVLSAEGVNLCSKRQNRGCFEVNGLMNNIRKAIKPICRKYHGKFRIDIDNKSAPERKRCMIIIRPILPNIPERAKAKYDKGVPHFVDGPFRGEEVIWSSREDSDTVPDENEIGEDIFVVEPDRYRATFYGWKKKY